MERKGDNFLTSENQVARLLGLHERLLEDRVMAPSSSLIPSNHTNCAINCLPPLAVLTAHLPFVIHGM